MQVPPNTDVGILVFTLAEKPASGRTVISLNCLPRLRLGYGVVTSADLGDVGGGPGESGSREPSHGAAARAIAGGGRVDSGATGVWIWRGAPPITFLPISPG